MKVILFFLCLLFFSHNLFSQDTREIDAMLSFKHRANSMLIRFKEGTSQTAKEAIFKKLGAIAVKEYSIVKDLHLLKLQGRNDLKTALLWAREEEEVLYSEPNYIRNLDKNPNDPYYTDNTLWGLKKIKAPESWNITTKSNIIIGVIDSGIAYKHEDLAGNIWTNLAEANGTPNVDDDNNGYVDDVHGYDFGDEEEEPDRNDPDPLPDGEYHGTHVAGIIGATGNNNRGVVGVCWNVKIMALKFINSAGDSPVSACIECIEYALRNGAKILNMSYGGTSYSKSEKDAMEEANRWKVLCVASAGNLASDNDVTPRYPCCYKLPNLIAVGASNDKDGLAYFSNFGANSVHLLAPGEGIYSTYEDNSYDFQNGTSMAAPHVTGSFALLWQRFPGLTPEQLIAKVLRNVDKIAGGRANTMTGGRINLLKTMNDVQEVKEDYGTGGGGSGCSSQHDKTPGTWEILPYLFLLFLFIWKKNK